MSMQRRARGDSDIQKHPLNFIINQCPNPGIKNFRLWIWTSLLSLNGIQGQWWLPFDFIIKSTSWNQKLRNLGRMCFQLRQQLNKYQCPSVSLSVCLSVCLSVSEQYVKIVIISHTKPYQTITNPTNPYQTIPNHTKPFGLYKDKLRTQIFKNRDQLGKDSFEKKKKL